MQYLSLFLFFVLCFIDSSIKRFPGIGIDIVNKSVSQPVLFTMGAVVLILTLTLCSIIIFKQLMIKKKWSYIKIIGSIAIGLLSVVLAISNPYTLTMGYAPLLFIIIVSVFTGYRISRRDRR